MTKTITSYEVAQELLTGLKVAVNILSQPQTEELPQWVTQHANLYFKTLADVSDGVAVII